MSNIVLSFFDQLVFTSFQRKKKTANSNSSKNAEQKKNIILGLTIFISIFGSDLVWKGNLQAQCSSACATNSVVMNLFVAIIFILLFHDWLKSFG